MEAPNDFITDEQKEEKNMLVLPYIKLRNFLGFIGLGLPFILILSSLPNGPFFRFSFSEYYYSWIGDIIIVLLVVQGTTLIIYNGYNKTERYFSTIAGIFAFLIAIVPTESKNLDTFTVHTVPRVSNTTLHDIFALVFFLMLAWMSIVWFTKTSNGGRRNIKFFIHILFNQKDTPKKRKNFIHLICGLVIIVSLIIMAIYIMLDRPSTFPVLFVGESVAFWAYSISWLVKGKVFIKDKTEKL